MLFGPNISYVYINFCLPPITGQPGFVLSGTQTRRQIRFMLISLNSRLQYRCNGSITKGYGPSGLCRIATSFCTSYRSMADNKFLLNVIPGPTDTVLPFKN